MTEVVNLRSKPFEAYVAPGSVVRIDRKSKWGNPFVIGKDGDRDEVIRKYESWLWARIRAGQFAIEDLAELDGKRLACWCAPLPCHGDVLAKAAKWAAIQ